MLHDTLMRARLPSDDRWTAAGNEGALTLFFPAELRTGVTTKQGETDAVLCHRIVNLDTGQAFENSLVFGAALVPNISPAAPDSSVLGRLTKGDRGAWILLPHTQEELYQAQKWIEENLT